MEGLPRTWVWMAIPLVVLAVNLVFPRSRQLKNIALFLLIGAVTLHAFAVHNVIYRSLLAIERWISPGNDLMSKEDMLRWLPQLRRDVSILGSELFLGLVAGIIFAAIPCDILSHRRSVTDET